MTASADLVAPLANMLVAALSANHERAEQDQFRPPEPQSDGLRPPVDDGTGARAHRVDGNTVIDADQEVVAAVADVFAAFQATGSAYAVVAAFKQRRFPRRAYGGVWAGELRWGRLTHSRVLGVLSNPAYAGAYVFGRYRTQRVVAPDGSVRETMREQPRADWGVVIQDHHPGYISWEQYVLNQQRLAANATRSGARPPREGAALCQGIVYCGSCGRAMSTNYRLSGRADYECAHSRADHVATAACRVIDAATVDH